MRSDEVRIALDMEGVLADSHNYAVENSLITYEDHLHTWGFEPEEHHELFMEVMDEAWEDPIDNIDLVDDDAPMYANLLNDRYDVTIVTARTGREDEMKMWCDHHGIEIDTLIATSTHKEKLDYNVYVDDNPYMWGIDDYLYLYDNPWNKTHPETGESLYDTERMKRVFSLGGVVLGLGTLAPVQADFTQ